MEIDYFIIDHDQNNYKKHFFNAPNLKFLFVGNKTENIIYENTIVCNSLKDNIENYPKLCSYTAWYAVAKNNLIKDKYVCLLEYDSQPSPNFFDKNLNIINESNYNNIVIKYEVSPLDHYVFTKSTPWLELVLKKIHGIDLKEFVNKYKESFPLWTTSTNTTIHTDLLKDFVDWFHPMTKYFKNDNLGAYVHERAFFIYCVLKGVKLCYVENVLKHYQKASHEMKDVYGSFLESKNTNTFEDYMKDECNIMYKKELKRAARTIRDSL